MTTPSPSFFLKEKRLEARLEVRLSATGISKDSWYIRFFSHSTNINQHLLYAGHCSRSPEQSTAKMPVLTAKVLSWPLQLNLDLPATHPSALPPTVLPLPLSLVLASLLILKIPYRGFHKLYLLFGILPLLFLSFIPTQLHRFLGHTLSCPPAMKPSWTEHFPRQASCSLMYS